MRNQLTPQTMPGYVSTRSGRRIENFTRVETFGSPDVHWLRATVDFHDPNLFSFRPEIVKQNLVDHQPSHATGGFVRAVIFEFSGLVFFFVTEAQLFEARFHHRLFILRQSALQEQFKG